MSRFFAVLFSWMGSKRARKWQARLDEPILREIINTLRKPTPTVWKARADVQLENRFYQLSQAYETAETIAEERSANLAARNQKTLADAEIGLVRCAQWKGTTVQEMPGELREMAERHGVWNMKKRNTKPTPREQKAVTSDS